MTARLAGGRSYGLNEIGIETGFRDSRSLLIASIISGDWSNSVFVFFVGSVAISITPLVDVPKLHRLCAFPQVTTHCNYVRVVMLLVKSCLPAEYYPRAAVMRTFDYLLRPHVKSF